MFTYSVTFHSTEQISEKGAMTEKVFRKWIAGIQCKLGNLKSPAYPHREKAQSRVDQLYLRKEKKANLKNSWFLSCLRLWHWRIMGRLSLELKLKSGSF